MSEALSLTEADAIMENLSFGPVRYKLSEVGVSWLNRRTNGKHAHRVGRRIISVEGFVRCRYKEALAHEGDPDDPLRIARHTNEVAAKDPRLAQVEMKPLAVATVAKAHLQSFLQALASGTVYWDDTGDLMVPPAGHATLLDHLQHGLYYKVIRWEAVVKHEDAVRQLVAGDNLDAAFALGQTDLALLEAIWASTKVLKLVAPMTS